jgi:hypothetical protein
VVSDADDTVWRASGYSTRNTKQNGNRLAIDPVVRSFGPQFLDMEFIPSVLGRLLDVENSEPDRSRGCHIRQESPHSALMPRDRSTAFPSGIPTCTFKSHYSTMTVVNDSQIRGS